MFLELKGVPQFVDCGKLVSTLPFLHADRTNAEYLLLMGIKGELHIRVGEIPCTITPRDIMIILPGTPISGLIPSRQLTYFWCHFNMSENRSFFPNRKLSAAIRSCFSRVIQTVPRSYHKPFISSIPPEPLFSASSC